MSTAEAITAADPMVVYDVANIYLCSAMAN